MNNIDVVKGIEQCFEECCVILGLEPYEVIGIGFNNDLPCWGRAHANILNEDPDENFVEINLKLFLRMPEAYPETVAHEVAHIATKGNGHGRRWKEAMRSLGYPNPKAKKVYDRNRKPIWTEGR